MSVTLVRRVSRTCGTDQPIRGEKKKQILTKLFTIKIALDELKKVGRYFPSFPFKIKLINLGEYFRKTLTYQQKLLAIGYWVSVNEYMGEC